MKFNDFVDDLAERVDALAPRSKAAVFWLLGSALAARLRPAEGWSTWFDEARSVGKSFVTTGEVDERARMVWAEARTPTGDQSSQLMNSAIVCLSTPVGIALDPSMKVGVWVEHALFPIMHRASRDLFDDVVLPGDEAELDAVFGHDRVQAAADYCRRIVADLGARSDPDEAALDRLARGSEAIAQVDSP